VNRANHLSTVVEVVFGATRLVLGGDLPTLESNSTTRVPAGWDLVMDRHPSLGAHHGLKLPHHGSAEAHHESLHRPRQAQQNRAWDPITNNLSAQAADPSRLASLLLVPARFVAPRCIS
jgi:hypothetical protein